MTTMRMEAGRPMMTVVDTRQALDLEALLHWAVARELADLALAGEEAGGWLRALRSGDGCATLLRRFEVGDAGGGGTVSAAGPAMAHPDALTVWAAARVALTDDMPALTLVRECARAQRRPDWGERLPVVALKPVLVWKGGKYRPQELAPRGGARWCVLQLQDNGEELARRRAIYLVWWRAMARIAAALEGAALSSRRCAGFAAPAKPWEVQKGA